MNRPISSHTDSGAVGKDSSLKITQFITAGYHVQNRNLGTDQLQQQRLQVCENNWVRKIARVMRADRRRMVVRDGSAEELDGETGEEQITVDWTRRKDGG